MKDHTLVRDEKDHGKLVDLFLLKSSTDWLEKQNWISSPYGGDNYLEDIILRVKLLSQQQWSEIFKEENKSEDLSRIKEYCEILKTIDPNIKVFYDHVVNEHG